MAASVKICAIRLMLPSLAGLGDKSPAPCGQQALQKNKKIKLQKIPITPPPVVKRSRPARERNAARLPQHPRDRPKIVPAAMSGLPPHFQVNRFGVSSARFGRGSVPRPSDIDVEGQRDVGNRPFPPLCARIGRKPLSS